jgi:hypothetical protein
MERRHSNWFANTAGAVLLATGTAKVWSSFGHAKVIAVPDPILGLPFGELMALVGGAELVVAVLCFCASVDLSLKIGLVAWLATNFLIYRVALWCIGWHHPCNCMGALAGAIHLPDQVADRIMKGVLVYLLVGSYVLLLCNVRTVQKAPSHAHVASAMPESRRNFSVVALALCVTLAFYFIILRLYAPSSSHADTVTVEFDPPVLDLGTIFQNQKIRRDFKLFNRGAHEVRILSIRSTCNCTAFGESLARRSVPAGGSVLIPVEYESSADDGTISSRVEVGVETAGKKYYVQARVQGQITADFAIVPRLVDFGTLKPGEHATKTINFVRGGSADVRIKRVRSTPGVAISLGRNGPGSQPGIPCSIEVTYDAPSTYVSQTFGGTVEVETSSAFMPLVKIPVSGTVAPDVEMTPQLIVLQKPRPSGECRITARTREPSRIIRLLALTSQGYQAVTGDALSGSLDDTMRVSHLCVFKNLALVGTKRLDFEFEVRKQAGGTETRSAFVEIKGL